MRCESILKLSIIISMMSSCSDTSSDNSESSFISEAIFTDFKDGTATIDFKEDQSGQEFILLPYYLGNIEKINGASEESSDFIISGPSLSLIQTFQDKTKTYMTPHDKSYLAEKLTKMVYNQFEPERGIHQKTGFWNIVSHLETIINEESSGLTEKRAYLKNSLLQSGRYLVDRKKNKHLKLVNEQSCLGSEGEDSSPYLTMDDNNPPETTIKNVIEHDEYCMLFLQNDGYAIKNKLSIQASIEKSISMFKNIIHNISVFPEKPIIFKPNFFFTKPSDIISGSDVTGVYIHALSKFNDRPVLVITHDLNSIGKDETIENIGEFYATLVHELQHAIHSYYRSHTSQDEIYIDEGLAHLIEDIAGYSDNNNFSSYAFSWLLTRSSGEFPFFSTGSYTFNQDSDFDSKARGAAHSFFYYLASQKGGFNTEKHTITNSDGLSFIGKISRSGNNGLKNISDIYQNTDLSWSHLIGNYLVSLFLDNNPEISNPASQHKIYTARNDIEDFQGISNKSFGMNYNNFKNLETGTDPSMLSQLKSETFSLRHYQTKPLYLKVSSEMTSVTIKSSAENAMIAYFRVK